MIFKLQIIAILILAFLSAVLYRMGGSGKFNTKVRDMGCTACLIAALIVLGFTHWSLLLAFGLQFGALTTYFKKKGKDAKFWNWLLVGLAYSLSALPIAFFYHDWIGFFIRTVALSGLIVLWSQLIGKDWLEEGGRGALIILTLPLLLIGKKKEKKT